MLLMLLARSVESMPSGTLTQLQRSLRERGDHMRRNGAVSTAPWMLLRLALETAAHHAQADEDRLAAMDVRTRAEYCAFLVRVYGFELPVEEAVWRAVGLGRDVLRDRNKADRLRQDLETLGSSADEIATLPMTTTVTIRSVPQALGWLFVIERHTLLAGLIRRHLALSVGETIGGAFNYLSAYCDTPGARFRALGEELGNYARRYAPSAIVAGAKEAFRAQRLWYRSCALAASSSRGTSVRPHSDAEAGHADSAIDAGALAG